MVQDTYFTNNGAGHILHEQWCRTHTSQTMVQDTYFTNNGAGHILHEQWCRSHTLNNGAGHILQEQWCRQDTYFRRKVEEKSCLSIYGIYIAPLQGNYSEALPAQARAKIKVLSSL